MLRGKIHFARLHFLALIWLACAVQSVDADTFIVSNTDDSGPGSLRQAILDANSAGGGWHRFEIQTGGTVTLVDPLPALNAFMTEITMLGPTDFTVTGNGPSINGSDDIFVDTWGTMSLQDLANRHRLEKYGEGTLTLKGTSTYSGGTFVHRGTLQGDTSSLQGDIDNWSNVTFDQAGTGTYAGRISGGGSVTKKGAGTLTLSGPNSYNGGTTVEAGVLRGDTSSLQGNINNHANVTFDQAVDGTYSGAISGTGSVTKKGTGSLTFSGVNNYSGLTTVDAGTLVVNGSLTGGVFANSGSRLMGSGTMGSATVSGTIAPGNSIGTLTVNGTYTQSAGSTYEVELNDGGTVAGVNNDLIDVTGAPGTATINGGTVAVTAAAGTYTPGTVYTILQTTGGVSGTYDNLTDNLTLRDFVLLYNPTTIQLQVIRSTTGLASSGNTFNQLAIGGALAAASATVSGEIGDVIDELALLPAAEQPAVLDQMTGQLYGTLSALGLQHTALIHQLLNRRLRNETGPAVTGWGRPMASNLTAANDTPVALVSHSCVENASCDTCLPRCSQWTGWAMGYGLGGDASTDRNAAAADYSLGGTLFGINRWLDSSAMVGLYGVYGRSNTDLATPRQTADVDSVQLGGFLRHQLSQGYFLLSGGAGYDDYETRRVISFGGVDQIAEGDNSGQQAIAALERGWTHCWNDYRVIPFTGLRYNYLHQNSFAETGAGALSLDVDGIDTHSLRSELGINVLRQMKHRRNVTGRLQAIWMHEFLDPVETFTSTIGGVASFSTRGLDLGRDWAVLGTGGQYHANRSTTLFCNYDLQLNSHQAFHVGSGGVTVSW